MGVRPDLRLVPQQGMVLRAEICRLAERSDHVLFADGVEAQRSIMHSVAAGHGGVGVVTWPDNEDSDSGLKVYGVGLQGRFIDTNEYIGLLTGFFRHENDFVNMFSGEIKLGYKIKRTTLYGALNLSYFDFEDNIDTFGMYLKDSTGDWMMLSYQNNVKNVLYVEGTMGVFSVLNKYITAKGELTYGSYDWHNQLNLRAELGYQPKDRFAVTLYGMVNLYDSANDMTRIYQQWDVNPKDATDYTGYETSNVFYRTGEYKIKNYNEWRIGAQAILYF